MKKVQNGVVCRVVGCLDGVNLGKIVTASVCMGEHSQLGRIWRCVSKNGELITEYGAVGLSADFAEDWLEPIEDDPVAPAQRYTHRSDPVYLNQLKVC